MATLAFDTLKYSRKLKEVGVPDNQAEVQAEMMAEAFGFYADNLVTNPSLDSRLGKQEARIDTRFAEQDTRLEKRFAEQDALIEKRFAEQDVLIEKRFAKQDALIEKRFAEQDARIEKRLAEQDALVEKRFVEQEAFIEQRFTNQEACLEKRFAEYDRKFDALKEQVHEQSTRIRVVLGKHDVILVAIFAAVVIPLVRDFLL